MADLNQKTNASYILPCLQSDEAMATFAALFLAETITADLDNSKSFKSIVNSFPQTMLSYHTSRNSLPHTQDLTKPPLTYKEAMICLDRALWQVMIDAEYKNLINQGVIEESVLLKGKHAIGFCWTFTRKTHPSVIEKAQLVAQSFSQRPDDYGDTYTPVAKMVSI